MPNGISEEDLNDDPESIIPLRRNPIIADIFRIMQRVELNGSGVSRMHESFKDLELPIPVIKTTDIPTVKVIFSRPGIEQLQGKSLSTAERISLAQRINALPRSEFEQLLFALGPPRGVIPSSDASQGMRASALLSWAESPSGIGLKNLIVTLGDIAPSIE